MRKLHSIIYPFLLNNESPLYLLASTFVFFNGFYFLSVILFFYSLYAFLCTHFTEVSEFRSTMKKDRAAREYHLNEEFYVSSLVNITLNVIVGFFRVGYSFF
jgi:hypothetical protein